MNHRIGRSEVQATASRLQADQKNRDCPRLETADRVGSITRGAGQLDIVDFNHSKFGLDQIKHRGELRKNQHPPAFAREFAQHLHQGRELAARYRRRRRNRRSGPRSRERLSHCRELDEARVAAHLPELQQRIEEWEALRPLRSTAEQVGPNEVWIKLEIGAAPPLETLATIFGDAIHNLRSALDSVVWEMATFDGAHPATADAERAVQFPLYDDPDKFKKWGERVGSISDELLVRLELEQPYHRVVALAQLGQVDSLVKLHEIDITEQ